MADLRVAIYVAWISGFCFGAAFAIAGAVIFVISKSARKKGNPDA